MKPCPSCGQSLADNATSCPHCGHRLTNIVTEAGGAILTVIVFIVIMMILGAIVVAIKG